MGYRLDGVACKLTVVKVSIEPALCKEFFVIAFFDNRAVIHYKNEFCILDSR